MKYLDCRYTLYKSDKLVYGCNTEKGMINHIKKICPVAVLDGGSGVMVADMKNSADDAIRERMYKVYGIGAFLVKRDWRLAHGICIRRNDNGTVDLCRKVTAHKNDGDYSEYNVTDYIILGSFKDVDKAVDFWQKEYGYVKSKNDGSTCLSYDMDFWKYSNPEEYQYSLDEVHDGYVFI